MTNFDLYLLKQSTKGKAGQEDASFSFYINAGLDLKNFEARYT